MQLDHVAVDILKKIATEPGMSIKALCERIGLPQRNFYYRRTRINDWLVAEGFRPLANDQGLHLQENDAQAVMVKLGQLHGQSYKLSADERRDHLLLLLFCSFSPLFTHHLSELNHVSRNTTLDDLGALKAFLSQRHLSLSVSKKRGYQITGDCLALRACMRQMLQRTLIYADERAEMRISRVLQESLAAVGIDGQQAQRAVGHGMAVAEQHLQRAFTDKDRRLLHYMIMFSLLDEARGIYPEFTAAQLEFLRRQSECETAAILHKVLARELSGTAWSGNTMYLTLLLCASKNLIRRPGSDPEGLRLLQSVRDLIARFQSLSGVYLSDVSQLELRLFAHLGPAIRRCLFTMHSENTLRDEVNKRYPLICSICRQIIIKLEREYQVRFDENELSYIAINFAAWLDRRPETDEKQILLVTEGGLSSAAILENQVRNTTVLPLNIIHRSLSYLQQHGIPQHIHLIVSTVPLSMTLPDETGFIQTSHMLTEGEKHQLRFMLENNLDKARINELINTLVVSATRHAPQSKALLEEEFRAVIHRFLHKQHISTSAGGKKLAEHLHRRVRFSRARQSTWRQAIRKAAQPLVDEGIIDRRYTQKIIKKIEMAGIVSYFTPDILLLHSTPPEGLNTGALSMLILREPLQFDVPGVTLTPRLVVILVPAKNLSHITLLEALNALIGNETALNMLLQASSLPDIKRCINTYA